MSPGRWIGLKTYATCGFLLSTPPDDEETMETHSRANPPEERKREVLPTAPKDEEVKFGSGNHWGQEHLKLLGVDFIYNGASI